MAIYNFTLKRMLNQSSCCILFTADARYIKLQIHHLSILRSTAPCLNTKVSSILCNKKLPKNRSTVVHQVFFYYLLLFLNHSSSPISALKYLQGIFIQSAGRSTKSIFTV